MKKVLEKYDIDYTQKISHGKYSCTYKGFSTKHSKVAIEEFLNTEDCPDPEKLEIKKFKKIKDPNILRIYAFGHTDTKFYVVKEYCKKSLKKHLEKSEDRKLSEEEIRNIGKQIGNVVKVLVKNRFDLNNLNMDNIFISKDGCIKISKPSVIGAFSLNHEGTLQ